MRGDRRVGWARERAGASGKGGVSLSVPVRVGGGGGKVDTRSWRASKKIEHIPLFIPRGLASPLRASLPPSTLGKVCFFTDFG